MGPRQPAGQYRRIVGRSPPGNVPLPLPHQSHYTNTTVHHQGGDRYQQAFYVFEEMAQAPSSTATKSLVGQAVAELHLGRLPEAEAALQQAMQRDPRDAEAIANSIVLNVISGKDMSGLKSSLEGSAPEHPLLVDLKEKSSLFDQAAKKYSAKVAS